MTHEIFQEVSQIAGIDWDGKRNAISVGWVDWNQDGLPDLWVAPHAIRAFPESFHPQLYLNQGGGTFEDIAVEVFPSRFFGDTHGTAWADYDNDGDQDLFAAVGGGSGEGFGKSLFFVNNEGLLEEQAVQQGLDFGLGRGRSATWFDGNYDGKLDLIQVTEARPDRQASTTFFQQTPSGFINANDQVDFSLTKGAITAQVADLFGNGSQDLIIFSDESNSLTVYETTPSQWNNISSRFPRISQVRDAAIADFNGDGISDIFLTRADESLSIWSNSNIWKGETSAGGRLIVRSNSQEAGISWKTSGSVTFNPNTNQLWQNFTHLPLNKIFIGSQGKNPTTKNFTLSSDDPTVFGSSSRSSPGLYISYDPSTEIWQAINFNTTYNALGLNIESSQPLRDLNTVGFTQPGPRGLGGLSPVLLIYDSETDEYVDRTEQAGLNSPVSSRSVVAGDFDNDQNVDLYLESSTAYYSLPSIFYQNQGDGTFLKIPDAAGAGIQAINMKEEHFNVGTNIVTADYDGDGFLDLFAGHQTIQLNEATTLTDRNFSLGIPSQLFRNQGNDNNWLRVNLVGVQSNRDGIGTKVFATARETTQLREQSGGTHRLGQNEKTLHFGLKDNETVDLLRIEWLSGAIQEISNIAANQVLEVIENRGTLGSDLLKGTPNNDTIEGLEGKDYLEGKAGNDTLYAENHATEDLVMKLNLDSETGGITEDSSNLGRDNKGFLKNGTIIDETNGYAVFDGLDDYIAITSSPDINLESHAKRTISMGFNAEDINLTDRKQILWEEGGNHSGLAIYIDNGLLYVGNWDGNQWETYLSTDQIQSGQWHQVTLVLDATPGSDTPEVGALKAYLDGVEFAQGEAGELKPHANGVGLGGLEGSTKLHDGVSQGAGELGFAGKIDDVSLYNRALSASEVEQLAVRYRETEDLVMKLNLDSETGGITEDSSNLGRDNKGFLKNGTIIDETNGYAVFDGLDDYIAITSSPDINLESHAKRTISMGFNAEDINLTDRKQILWEEGGNHSGLAIYIDNGLLYVGSWDGNQWDTYLSTDQIQSGQWHQVTLVLDATPGSDTPEVGALKAYLDGVEFAEGEAGELKSHANGIGLGGLEGSTKLHDGVSQGAGELGFAGKIDDVSLYNRALSASEVEQLTHPFVGDVLDGGPGDDKLYASRNNNLLIGGSGADEFWLANNDLMPTKAHKIEDFELNRDRIGIGISGVSFENIGRTQVGNNTWVTALGTELAILTGIQASELNGDHFILS